MASEAEPERLQRRGIVGNLPIGVKKAIAEACAEIGDWLETKIGRGVTRRRITNRNVTVRRAWARLIWGALTSNAEGWAQSGIARARTPPGRIASWTQRSNVGLLELARLKLDWLVNTGLTQLQLGAPHYGAPAYLQLANDAVFESLDRGRGRRLDWIAYLDEQHTVTPDFDGHDFLQHYH